MSEATTWKIEQGAGGMDIRVDAIFGRYRPLIASPMKTVVLRLLRFLGPAFNAYFKRRLIQQAEILPDVRLVRHIVVEFSKGSLTVEDSVEGLRRNDRLSAAPPSSLRTVPSARFFQAGEEAASLLANKGQEEPTRRFVINLDQSDTSV